jgi:hypothetical protein
MFSALALPEVIFIYRSTGKVRLEAKSAINFAQSARILDWQTSIAADHGLADAQGDEAQKWAGHAIGANLEETGIWMRRNADVIRETRMTLKGFAHFVKKAVRHNTPVLLQLLSSRWLGAPFLPALALLGALRRPWRRPLAAGRLFIMLVPAAAVVAGFSVIIVYPRNYFVLVPFLLIWAANGLVEIGLWTAASTSAAGWQWLFPAVSRSIIPGLIGVATVIYPIKGVRELYEFQEGSPATRVAREAGLWIGRQQDHTVKIMDRSTPLAFHADAQFVYFPYCSGELALRFLDAAKVDYVVLRRHEKFTQYYDDWLNNGIPDSRAQVVYVSSDANAGDIVVYRWHRVENGLLQLPAGTP